MVKLRLVEIESRSAGWINCPITDSRHVVVSLELKGPDNSLRVRQIRVLGEVEGESLKIGKQLNAAAIQQRNCEAETLKVFRLITSQVEIRKVHLLTKFRNIRIRHVLWTFV